ncbi:FAD-dependent oxidoreductase, partial [Nitrospinota bacterium]
SPLPFGDTTRKGEAVERPGQRHPTLFSGGRIGGLSLRNRIIAAPMEKNLADPDGSVTQRYVAYAVERARGGAALISPESLFIHPEGKGNPFQLGIHDDAMIPGLMRLCGAVHDEGAALMAEINHAGRQASSSAGHQPVGPSPVAYEGFRPGEVPMELTAGEMGEILQMFSAAAKRAKEAGFDVVQLHGAHGYLINQFLSPRSNKREDSYGGSLENRMRFPLEAVRAVREAVGPEFPVAYRITADEGVEGGLPFHEVLAFCKVLEEAGVALIDVSAGTYESSALITPSMEAPIGCHVSLAERIRGAVSVPVSVAGRILDGDTAEEILRAGRADFVTMGRALHADPQLPRKTQMGHPEEVRPCVGCLKCSDLLGAGEPVRCTVNSQAGQEEETRIYPAAVIKRVLVVGGGPGGLEAARVAALRGHEVTLMEMAGELGGQIRYAAMAPGRADLILLIGSLEAEVRQLGVEVRFWTAVDVEVVRAHMPDEVVLAAGALGAHPSVAGFSSAAVADPFDAMANGWSGDGRVLVVGGLMRGCAAAARLADCGGEVVLLESGDELATDLGPRARHPLVQRLLARENVTTILGATLEEVKGEEVCIRQGDGKDSHVNGVSLIVPTRSMSPQNELHDSLAAEIPDLPVHIIGDCRCPRDAFAAVQEGAVHARGL